MGEDLTSERAQLERLGEIEARLRAHGDRLPAALRRECGQALQLIAHHAGRGGQHQVAQRARAMLARLGER